MTRKPEGYDDWLESLRREGKGNGFAPIGIILVSLALVLTFVMTMIPAYDWAARDGDENISVPVTGATDDGKTKTVQSIVEESYRFVVSIHSIGETSEKTPGFAASGSGVIISADGYVITNKHVIATADKIYVRLNGETESELATLVSISSGWDLAILKIERTGLTPGVLAKNNTVTVGDTVTAVGYSLGLDGLPSVSKGIVSGVGRTLDTRDGVMSEMIQTDAALSSGNSGGPLLNEKGDIVGINTFVLEGGGRESVANMGFAIGSDQVAVFVNDSTRNDAKLTDQLEPGLLGVDVTGRPQGSLGVLVNGVKTGGGAQIAGIVEGDIILSINGAPVYSATGIRGMLKNLKEGQGVKIGIMRKDVAITYDVVLGAR